MLSLPPDMIHEIIQYLSTKDMIHLSRVLKRPIDLHQWFKPLQYNIEVTEPLYDNEKLFKLNDSEKLILTYGCSDEYAILITSFNQKFIVYEFANKYYRPDDESYESREYHRERNDDRLEYQDHDFYASLNDIKRFYHAFNQRQYDIKPYDILKYL